MPRHGVGLGLGLDRGAVVIPGGSGDVKLSSGVSLSTATAEATSLRTRASSGVSLATVSGEAASLRTRASSGVSLATATAEATSLRTRASSGVSLATATGVATSVRTAWDFGQLPGVQAYFQPDVGMTVSSWTDQAGGDDNLAQATAGLQPSKISSALNGWSALRFTTSEWMEIADSGDRLDVGTGAFYVYAVVKWLSGAGAFHCFAGKGTASSSDNWRVFKNSGNQLAVNCGNATGNGSSFTLADNEWHLVMWGCQGAANPAILKYLKDSVVSSNSNSSNYSAFNGANALNTRLSQDPGGFTTSNMDVAEWCFCKGTVHTTTEFTRAWNYAQSKFAL